MINLLIINNKKGEEIKQDQKVTITATCGEITSEIEITVNAFNNSEKLAYTEVEGGYSVRAAKSISIVGKLIIPEIYNDKPVITIAREGFSSQKQMTSVIIPHSVTLISYGAFVGCTSLVDVTIGSGVTTIESGILLACQSLNHIDVTGNSNFTMIGGVDQYTGCLVKGTTIASDCSNVIATTHEVVLAEIVKTIKDSAFSGCDSLTAIVITNTVTSIGNRAFQNCVGLTSLIIGSSVTLIGNNICGQSALTSIIIDPANEKYILANNVGMAMVVVDKSTGLLNNTCSNIVGGLVCGDLIIPDTVTSIPINFLQDCVGLTGVFIETNIRLDNAAFKNCKNLTTADIKSISIGNEAFYGCSNLTSIIIHDGITSIGDNTFMGCTSLAAITIPNSVKSMGSGVFSGCSSLKNITLSDTLNSIKDDTFYGCVSLASIIVPNTITLIGKQAFYNCSSLENIIIPDKILSIEERTFSGCSNLTTVSIGSGVTSISFDAFYNCPLRSITIDPTNEKYILAADVGSALVVIDKTMGVTTISNDCSNIVMGLAVGDLILPDSVTSIVDSAFAYSFGLTSITLNDNITSISGGTFMECANLTSVAISNSVTSIGWSAFGLCSGLTNIIIPDSVQEVEGYAFSWCDSLVDVSIGSGIKIIGEYIFSDCKNLKTLTITAEIPPTIDDLLFSGVVPEGFLIKVPRASVDAYKAFAGWSVYKDFIVAI